jgi:molybdate transport system permease protein
MRRRAFATAAAIATALLVTFLALPVIAVFVHTSPGRLVAKLGERSSLEALRLSLETTVAALALILAIGTPAAWFLARHRFRGHSLVTTVIELPIVLPPAVAGLALLVAFGPHGLVGGAIDSLGVRLVFETAGVVVALAFVSAPFYVRAAQAAFASLDPDLLAASRTLGAGEAKTLMRVAVPVSRSALAAGVALAWGRALGEFGATLIFAGSLEGVTQTTPLAIFAGFATDLDGALALAAVLVAVSAAILVAVKLIDRPLADAVRA